MPLIACPECGAEVSNKALQCVKCGAQIRKPRRSVVGQIVKGLFIVFNALMVVLMIVSISSMAESTRDFSRMSEVQQAGTAIGVGLGVGFVLVVWAIGSVILGLFVLVTRPR